MKNFSKITKRIFSLALVFTLFTGALSVQAATAAQMTTLKPGYGTVSMTSGNLNVRQAPSTSSAIVGSLPNYSNVMVVGQAGDFYRVQYNTAGHYGYVSKLYVNLNTSTKAYLTVDITSGTLNMRSGPGQNYGVVVGIPKDKAFAYVSATTNSAGGWYRGVYGNAIGYTSSQFTSIHNF